MRPVLMTGLAERWVPVSEPSGAPGPSALQVQVLQVVFAGYRRLGLGGMDGAERRTAGLERGLLFSLGERDPALLAVIGQVFQRVLLELHGAIVARVAGQR
jgi:hypothetical protein